MSKHKICCPHCGQPIFLPQEFRELQLRGHEVAALLMLYKRSPGIIVYSSLAKKKGTAVQIATKIRSALRDIGSEWELINIHDLGYSLRRKAEQAAVDGRRD